MTTAAKLHAVTIALACALALMATPPTLARTRAGTHGVGALAQYCAPPYDISDLHRVYCRDRG